MSALALALVLVVAQVDGGVPDVPRVTHLTSGDYLFSPAAFEAVDSELKRLQTSEAESKRLRAEGTPWVTVVLVSVATGLVVGLASGFFLGSVTAKK